MSTSISAGGLLVLGPSNQRVITMDWDTEALPATVTIASSNFTITPIRQAGSMLGLDNTSILAGNRKTQLRLDATLATVGDLYMVINVIVTAESPAQTIDGVFQVLVQNQ